MYINKIIVKVTYLVLKFQESLSVNLLKNLIGNKRYFRIKNKIIINSVIHKYNKRPFKSDLKRIILVFNGDVYNAGLADRLRSITSIYYWCRINNLDFKIYFSSPFELTRFLKPNIVDWELHSHELDYKNSLPQALISYNKIFGEEENMQLHRKALDNLLSEKVGEIHLYSNTYCYDEYFYDCFNDLFKLDDLLECELKNIQKDIGGDYITLSFRFTQLLGDLKDTNGTALSNRERANLINTCIKAIEIIVADSEVKRCVVTSDSISFINEIRNHPLVYLIPGPIGHISNEVDEMQIRKTFWDMFIISRAKKAYMVRTPIMYKSGFAMRAAMIGNIPFEEVIIE